MNSDEVRAAEKVLHEAHAKQLKDQWQTPGVEPPEWYDHRIDLYMWYDHKDVTWVERGVFARALMRPGDRILDLACGDGFYPLLFYSNVTKHIDAIDIDPKAIEHAQKLHAAENISYRTGDLLDFSWAEAKYDVVVMNAAIEHFSQEDIGRICEAVKKTGCRSFVGATIAMRPEGAYRHPDHKHEFESADAMGQHLRKFFHEVEVTETRYPDRDRTNLYFVCGEPVFRIMK